MNKSVSFLLAVFLFLVVLGSGCVLPEMNAVEMAKENPAVADFLAKHPNSEIGQVVAWNKAQTQDRISELRQKCGYQTLVTDYYYVSFLENSAMVEAWVYQKTMKVACVHRHDDQCSVNADCEDGLPCTRDVCEGIPKVCVKEKIKECVGGDGCCPQGCSYAVDYDCPEDECLSDLDCDDYNASTRDVCSGRPRACSHEAITRCENGDGYCPEGCNYENDTDCEIGECETDADCNDGDGSTRDYCSGTPKVCYHEIARECVDNDDYCPPNCNYRTDNDCVAASGNEERVSVTCNGSTTNIDNDLLNYGSELKASFNDPVNSANNETLKFYQYKQYKYNNIETKNTGRETGMNTTIVERITVNARAVYDKGLMENLLYFNRNGLEYEVELISGIPAVETETNQVPFEAGNDDSIAIVLFGKDALVRNVNQNEGEEQVKLLADYTEISVGEGGVARNLKGKTGKDYMMFISRCDEESAVFSLYGEGGSELIAGQEAKTGDVLFEEELKNSVVLTYLNKDYSNERCEFNYAKGPYLEEIHHGKEFPLGSDSLWKTYLEFANNKLTRIKFSYEGFSDDSPIKVGEELQILPEGKTQGEGFCTVKFVGLIK